MGIGSGLTTRALSALRRNALFAGLCIAGLAVGLIAMLFIALHIRSELTYDRWVPDGAQVFRVALGLQLGNTQEPPAAGTAAPIAGWLKGDFSEIAAAGRLKAQSRRLRYPTGSSRETIYWADAELMDVLPFPVFQGELRAALDDPQSAVLTRSAARRAFGTDTPIGERLSVEEAGDFVVRAVIEDLPARSHLAFDVLLSSRSRFSSLPPMDAPIRLDVSFAELASVLTYIRLRPGADAGSMATRVQETTERHVQIPRGADGRPLVPVPRLHLQPLRELHFVPAGQHSMKPAAKRSTLQVLGVIAALILGVASINFINLLTARAPRRAREVAVAKAAGAKRSQLLGLFLVEALLMTVAATLLALSLTELLLPHVGAVLGLEAGLHWWDEPLLVVALVGGALGLGLLAGLYPALVLSSFRPSALTRLEQHASGTGARLRTLLVSLQFAVLIGLGSAALVLRAQAGYAGGAGLVIDARDVLSIDDACEGRFAAAVRALPGVAAAACSDAQPGLGGGRGAVIPGRPGSAPISATFVSVEPGFLELFGLRPLAGRLFEPGRDADVSRLAPFAQAMPLGGAVVINETALRTLGYSSASAALGQPARLLASDPEPPVIIGVVADFPLQGVRHEIQPTAFRRVPGLPRHLLVKLRSGAARETRVAIDGLWQQYGDGEPLRARSLEAAIAGQYADVGRETGVLTAFCAVALAIACLGLFGLSAFLAERRVREIGIRKAFGAQTRHVLRQVLWQFAGPVLAANLLAWPVAAWALQRWLEGFVYHVTLGPAVFVTASLASIAVALATVGIHSFRAASVPPAVALRHY